MAVRNTNFRRQTPIVITCDTQEEIDHYWEKLGDGGKYSQCGWLDDKFGVSWQIVPAILGELGQSKLELPTSAVYVHHRTDK